MSDTASFLHELARQVKRHPQSYPTWLAILADDIVEATDNVERRGRIRDPDADLWRRFASDDA